MYLKNLNENDAGRQTATQRLALRIYKTAGLKWSIAHRSPLVTIPSDAIGCLRYFQFNARTAPFITSLAGSKTACVATTPHAAFVRSVVAGEAENREDIAHRYARYLSVSWGHPVDGRIAKKMDSFRALIGMFEKSQRAIAPVVLTRLTDGGPLYVVDGNHRCAIAYTLGRDIKARIAPIEKVILQGLSSRYFVRVVPWLQLTEPFHLNADASFAADYDEARLLDALPAACIENKRILDVGCGFGARALMVWARGAANVYGVDPRHGYADLATRSSVLRGDWPDVSFSTTLPVPAPNRDGPQYQTVFLKDALGSPETVAAHLRDLCRFGWNYLCLIAPSSFQPERQVSLSSYRARNLGTLTSTGRNSSLSLTAWLFEAET